MVSAIDYRCSHERSEIRRKTASNGKPMYGAQCLICGNMAGSWLKKADWPESAPEWDDSISTEYYDTLAKRSKHDAEVRRASQKEEFWQRYAVYLDSYDWSERRRLVIERESGLCQGCRKNRGTVVHHLTYERVFNELLTDLVLFCRDCHKKAHPEHSNDNDH